MPANRIRLRRVAGREGDAMTDLKVTAADNADWTQVVLHKGPPCFHLDINATFCLRAERWHGHDVQHAFVSLADLLRELTQRHAAEVEAAFTEGFWRDNNYGRLTANEAWLASKAREELNRATRGTP
jgi:hypothetical protein